MPSTAAPTAKVGNRVCPTGSWRWDRNHHLAAIESDWYRQLLALQDVITTSTMRFWSGRGVRSGHLFGVRTFLADSMQFGLEYLCRLSPLGAYYVMPSFRALFPRLELRQ